jgi:hypothetical protein
VTAPYHRKVYITWDWFEIHIPKMEYDERRTHEMQTDGSTGIQVGVTNALRRG